MTWPSAKPRSRRAPKNRCWINRRDPASGNNQRLIGSASNAAAISPANSSCPERVARIT
jgi:hypothetical protein